MKILKICMFHRLLSCKNSQNKEEDVDRINSCDEMTTS
jgi:hypothetical protein